MSVVECIYVSSGVYILEEGGEVNDEVGACCTCTIVEIPEMSCW